MLKQHEGEKMNEASKFYMLTTDERQRQFNEAIEGLRAMGARLASELSAELATLAARKHLTLGDLFGGMTDEQAATILKATRETVAATVDHIAKLRPAMVAGISEHMRDVFALVASLPPVMFPPELRAEALGARARREAFASHHPAPVVPDIEIEGVQ